MFHSCIENGYEISVPRSINGYYIHKEINKGASSVVVKVEDTFSNRFYAAKIISKEDMKKQNMLKSIYNEIETHRTLDHPNIIKLYEWFTIKNDKNKEFIIIILEYCSKGCLFDYTNDYGFKNENEKIKISMEIVKAVKYLHSREITHGDIKLENILLDNNLHPKLCDFGFCKNFKKDHHDESIRGSLNYAAPELLKTAPVDFFKSDIWALGVTLYAMNETKFPFSNIYEVMNGNLLIVTENKKFKKLIEKLIVFDPKKRLKAHEILEDEYFQIEFK